MVRNAKSIVNGCCKFERKKKGGGGRLIRQTRPLKEHRQLMGTDRLGWGIKTAIKLSLSSEKLKIVHVMTIELLWNTTKHLLYILFEIDVNNQTAKLIDANKIECIAYLSEIIGSQVCVYYSILSMFYRVVAGDANFFSLAKLVAEVCFFIHYTIIVIGFRAAEEEPRHIALGSTRSS